MFKFKVLVYDNQSESMIAPLFKVGDLRECNVVMHVNINSKRDACPGVPAVYLVEPTEQNYKSIARDCSYNMYDFVFINFTRLVTEQDLDKFAIEMTRVNGAHKICRVAFEHLGAYQVVNKDFFSFYNHRSNFTDLYQQRNEDAILDKVAKDLFETFCSLGVAPIIRVDQRDD